MLSNDIKFILNSFISIKQEIRLESEESLKFYVNNFPYLLTNEPIL